MNLARSILPILAGATLATTAQAAQVSRALTNTNSSGQFLLSQPQSSGDPDRQSFRNNLDYVDTVWMLVGGYMQSSTDTLTVKLYNACGTLVTTASAVFTNVNLQTPASTKWVEVHLPAPVALTYGAYYHLEFYNNVGQAKFVGNADRFNFGKLTGYDASEVRFPKKKRDVMFMLTGTTESSKQHFAPATTNMACPSRCILANPSGVENVNYNPEYSFNVIIRERVLTNPPYGSFWADYTAGTLATLKQEVAAMLQGSAASPGLRETYPYNNYAPPGMPFHYSNTNFYIAVEDPAVDQARYGGTTHRGFDYCANIDAAIDIKTGPSDTPFGAAPGSMWGEVLRPSAGSSGWGANMRPVLVHEVFGHGVPALTDEYINTDPMNPYKTVVTAPSINGGYLANALNISTTGCSEWCGGTQPVSWLVGQMAGNRDAACWSKTTQSTCDAPGGSAACRWIGSLPAIPYWGSYKCIPLNAALYNIGVNCPAFGNHSCYPLAPYGTTGGAMMDTVQPGGAIMQSGRPAPVSGFTSHVETHVKDLLDCVLTYSPCSVPEATCHALVSRYGTPGSGFMTYLEGAKACDGGFIRRR